ncbi:M23 family metallopeptidase [Streptomyces sp. H27-D2]|uniref:M23 family metallopeptidase n=1 Tax=Streptomyces sp. H27-D2 TaxID=3046304 RepID=UPI002DBFF6F0|nr:M23 family metallopeptidase [Streptomyces sp. H27-D2]MEC4016864.1 M23 family metallopeptidase [Streptomyces sp. H27-D2]
MTQHTTTFRGASKSTRRSMRTRAAIVAAGMGASVALGAGVALAADTSTSTSSDALSAASAHSLSGALRDQAGDQQKAADAKVKAAADAKERAVKKAASDRSKRAELVKSWVKPVNKYSLGSTFGIGGSHWSHKHSGQDFVVPEGTSVKAAHGGTVVDAGWGGAYGNNIVIKHDGHTFTQYGHLSKLDVKVGQKVATGQDIAKSGSTGNSTGPHLHFETRKTAVYGSGVEPVKFMKAHGVGV